MSSSPTSKPKNICSCRSRRHWVESDAALEPAEAFSIFSCTARNSRVQSRKAAAAFYAISQRAASMLSLSSRERNVNKRSIFRYEVEKYKQTIGWWRVTPDALRLLPNFLVNSYLDAIYRASPCCCHLRASCHKSKYWLNRIENWFEAISSMGSFAIVQGILQRMSFGSGCVRMNHGFPLSALIPCRIGKSR